VNIFKTALRLLRKVALVFVIVTVCMVAALRWVDPPVTSFMLQHLWQARADGEKAPSVRYTWVDYQDISPFVPLAFVASEDQKFPLHHGFDLEEIEKAIKHNRAGKRLRGASTISQQVAKNLFLWRTRSYTRKVVEAYFTFLVEILWPKQRILEMYVNIVHMGGNVFGVGAASRHFFGKPADSLRPEQAALLAAVLPSPSRYRADKPSVYVFVRRDRILTQMNLLGGTSYLNNM